MRHAVGANKVVGQTADVGIVFRQVIGAFLDDGHKPGLVGQSSRKIDADVRHLTRAYDGGGVAGGLGFDGALRIFGGCELLRTGQAQTSAIVGLAGGPDAGEVGLAVRQARRGGRHIHAAIGFPGHTGGGYR